MSLLQLRNLRVSLEQRDRSRRDVVRGASFDVAPGERLGLIGNSGSGKTTAVLAMMGLLPATATVSGRILWRGTDILHGGEGTIRPHRWRDIALIPQGSMNALNPVRRIGAQIAEPIEFHGIATGAATGRRVDELLEVVGLPRSCAARYPHELSGGMRQRAVIAMALSCDPALLLADEPTTALDVVVQAQILDVLRRASKARGVAVLLVTHDLAVVAQLCQRVVVMHDGQPVEQGAIDAIYERPTNPQTRELLRAAQRASPMPRLPEMRVGGKPEQVALDVEGLRVDYARPRTIAARLRGQAAAPTHAVHGVSLRINAGEILALVGETGCGKTTTAMAILRLLQPSAGTVHVGGRDVATLPPARLRAWRSHAQMIFQDPYDALDPRVSVERAVEEPLRIHAVCDSPDERHARSVTAMQAAGLTPASAFAPSRPHELSGGERQRAVLAASTVLDPELLIADEPVSMLDASVRASVLSLLSTLCRERGMALLLITHDLLSAAWIADRIAVMYLGRIVETGPAEAMMTRPRHPYTKALLAAIPRMDRRASPSPQGRSEVDGAHLETGCRYRARCPLADDRCATVDPELRPVVDAAGDEHLVACIHV